MSRQSKILLRQVRHLQKWGCTRAVRRRMRRIEEYERGVKNEHFKRTYMGQLNPEKLLEAFKKDLNLISFQYNVEGSRLEIEAKVRTKAYLDHIVTTVKV